MNILDFTNKYPNEEVCRRKLKEMREQIGIVCKRCKRTDHFWLKNTERWQCRRCTSRTNLKAGTVMSNSKIPVRYWFIMMFLILNVRKPISTKELKYQLGFKRYEPIWYMRQKILMLMDELQISKTEDLL